MTVPPLPDHAAGLGLRRPLLAAMRTASAGAFDFLEVAPENWIGVGGALGEGFADLASRHPVVCHGLSLSVGGPAPLDEPFLLKLRRFMDTHRCPLYSEHLSACGDSRGHLYDLLPLPFTEAAVHHVAARIRRVQDVLGQRIAIENISYYAAPFRELDEIDFVNAVLAEADCLLLLDVNNVYVSSVNHEFDPITYLDAIPADRVQQIHLAGHESHGDYLIDTHDRPVPDAVWSLYREALKRFGVVPTMIERDANIPPLAELEAELRIARRMAERAIAEAA